MVRGKIFGRSFNSTILKAKSRTLLKTGRGQTAAATAGRVGVGLDCRWLRSKVLLPNFKAAGVEFCSIASASGVSARDVGTKFGFARFLSDAQSVINDDDVNLIVIATRQVSCRARETGSGAG